MTERFNAIEAIADTDVSDKDKLTHTMTLLRGYKDDPQELDKLIEDVERYVEANLSNWENDQMPQWLFIVYQAAWNGFTLSLANKRKGLNQ